MDTSYSEQMMIEIKQILNNAIEEENLNNICSGDNSLLLSEMNNFQFDSINNSLKKMYQWYNRNKHIIKREKFEY